MIAARVLTAALVLAIAALAPSLAEAQPRATANREDARPSRALRDDPNHPGNNPKHPLKDPKVDPGPGRHDSPDGGTPAVQSSSANWPWGELVYGKTYNTTLTVTNDCWQAETVGVFVTNLPYVTLPPSVTVPPRSSKDFPIAIVTPPEPKLVLTGRETIPPHGIFGDIKGEVVLWHPWTFDPQCFPKRESYQASGHIHYDLTKPADGPPSREKIAGADACQVWWNTGQRPAQITSDDECTNRIRTLAADYRQYYLQPLAARAPGAWQWLPAPDRITGLSVGELLAMKAKADAQARER